MLNADTKRRINACRDILVGKVTDPKAQVEQITIALMYKFMNDLDHEVRDLGGTASFFAGDFAAYSWDRITDTRLGGEERLKLYADGIEKVVTNPGVPELFRQIFRNAYLPYRDPETFNLFSQEISGFAYDHSEDLGDAFEYLLSVMQSQGDAGQFRTPRHIIDFMVEVVKPQPGEAVLDPACGTAGFLISAYKHIVKHHPQLTPAQLEDLHRNVEGYDISPDMVRLSRVNLYLHQFADPRVIEYDTLTSDDRWGQRFDVILANPPFMTPKGGIRPHRKFSLESNRSEVLFVDYIAEHLMAGGRAAVIVPEGIIFQSGKAYRQLRRMLVENSLWAVASLPAGVFNPYSGVKTSILFLDRGIAEKSGPVLFAQIKADGHDLGAQRRVVAANDLPAALALLDDAHRRLKTGQVPTDYRDGLSEHPTLTHLFVPRAALLAEADCNLSGERYRVAAATGPRKWPMVKLGEVTLKSHVGLVRNKGEQTSFPSSSSSIAYLKMDSISIDGNLDLSRSVFVTAGADELVAYALNDGDFLYNTRNAPNLVGKSAVFHGPAATFLPNNNLQVVRFDENVSPDFVNSVVNSAPGKSQIRALVSGTTSVAALYWRDFAKIEIPLPPLSVQQEIVAEVARYQTVIDGARQVVDHWKPSFAVDPEWPVVKLGGVSTFSSGGTPAKTNDEFWSGDIPWVSAKDMKTEVLHGASTHISATALIDSATRLAPVGSILILVRGMGLANGVPICELAVPCAFNQDVKAVQPDPSVNPTYLRIALKAHEEQFRQIMETAAHGTLKIDTDALRMIEFALPPMSVQRAIVDRVEAERVLVDANKKLVELMKRRIDETMARVWN